MPALRAREIVSGIIITTRGVLFMKADITIVVPRSPRSTATGPSMARLFRPPASRSRTPVRTSAALRMNIATMVGGALFDSDASMSVLSTTPRSRSSAAPAIATTSGG